MSKNITFNDLLHQTPQNPYFLNPLVSEIDYTAALATLEDFISRNTISPEDANIQADVARILAPYGFKAINFNHGETTNTLYLRLGANSQLPQAIARVLGEDALLDPNNEHVHLSWEKVREQYERAKLDQAKIDGVAIPPLSDLPIFAFAGHTDVVPPGDLSKWTYNQPFAPDYHENVATNPYRPIEDIDEYVGAIQGQSKAALLFQENFSPMQQSCYTQYLQHPEYSLVGRGATDMKGGLVASIFALTAILDSFKASKELDNVSFAFLFTSDEEAVALHGTKYVVEELEKVGQEFAWCVIAEPSSDKYVGDTIRNGRRGSASWWITAKGEQGHVAYPHLVDNPIHKLIPVVNAIQQELAQLDQGNSNFPPTSFQLVELSAGDGTTNVVPGTARAQFNIRFNDEHTYASLQEKVNEIIARFPEYNSSLEVVTNCSGESFVTPKDNSFCLDTALCLTLLTQGLLKPRFDTGGGTSDGRFITRICPQMFELGTTNGTLHKVNEQVVLGEFFTLIQIYYILTAKTIGLIQFDGNQDYKAHCVEPKPQPNLPNLEVNKSRIRLKQE
ncbi:succinyl-diaminopimelate desuccinylase [Psittacicella melopsittaci]|uniref:Succinyl-diaminopimelate desuccinylase n=1 Tax=Psittacicella melopsittaci TaxID=2028576 RepID=A0A3A1Y4M5_9GAMM|nr:succinyl-diaminopimelate desuccinylase [Psittacicella melopsittaci]RIY32249.1 succinyl-diaminopimelate desuccinylase [Psittacicella melopsittaci]